MDEFSEKRKKKEGDVESEAQGEGVKKKLKEKSKLLFAETKEIREDIGVEYPLIPTSRKDHEFQNNPSHSFSPHSISFILQDPHKPFRWRHLYNVQKFLREFQLRVKKIFLGGVKVQ